MKHVVLSTDASGQPKIDDVSSLDEALELVERLRNDAAVDDVRVLREVPIEVKTYYKVVALEDAAAPAAEAQAAAPQAALVDDVASASEPVPAAPVGDNGAQPAPEVAEVPAESASEPPPPPSGDDGFFTPPPVRSHAVEGEDELPEGATSERRTSLFGRG